jgi:hypothetical protein
MKGIGLTPPSIPEEATWLSQGGFLFDPVHGMTFSMNDTGAFIYQMLRDGLGIPEIVNAMAGRFEVDSSVARLDVEDFIAQMRAAGLR